MRKLTRVMLGAVLLSLSLTAGCQSKEADPQKGQVTVTMAPTGETNSPDSKDAENDEKVVPPDRGEGPAIIEKFDENGNQTGGEDVDLKKAVSAAYAEENVPYSAMMRISINPYLMLYLDKDETVLAYCYENQDAADAYKGISFTGDTVRETVKKVTNAALDTEYLKPNAEMVIEVAEVKDESFQINEAMYVATVAANKTLRERNEKAEVMKAMPTEVAELAEQQGEFELADLDKPQDITYLTEMLDYSATMQVGTDEKVTLFLDEKGRIMGYGYEDEKESVELPLTGAKVTEATQMITEQLIRDEKLTTDQTLVVEVAEVIDVYFPVNEVCEKTQETVENTLKQEKVEAQIKVEKPENTPEEDLVRPEDICGRCNGQKYIVCGHCDGGIFTECPDCHGRDLGDCPTCGGSKTLACDLCNGSGYDPKNCPYCKGTGNCPACGGSGKEMTDQGTMGPCHKCRGDGHCTNLFNGVTARCYGHGPCPRCHMSKVRECNECNGTGKAICNTCHGEVGGECTYCHGTTHEVCPDCNGTGKRE